jgi:apolipoprotein D and lipocalin family protein
MMHHISSKLNAFALSVACFSALPVVTPSATAAEVFSRRLEKTELPVVSHVDLSQYMGRWYEIASFPKWFSSDCFNSQATYELRDDGKVDVINECRKHSAPHKWSRVNGVATVVDETSNAKLKVRFGLNPFAGDYWIIDLASDYSYAVVSEPSRESLWILSRTETLDKDVLGKILARLQNELYFDLTDLEFTRQ